MNYDKIINCPKSGGDLCYQTEINKDTLVEIDIHLYCVILNRE